MANLFQEFSVDKEDAQWTLDTPRNTNTDTQTYYKESLLVL